MEKASERERAIFHFSVRYRVRVFSEGYISGEAFFQEGFFRDTINYECSIRMTGAFLSLQLPTGILAVSIQLSLYFLPSVLSLCLVLS